MIEVEKIDFPVITHQQHQFIYIYTPFCGTCKVAKKMLDTIESMDGTPTFLAMNASLFPNFMQEHQIESVPCLVVMRKGKILKKIYAFKSVLDMLENVKAYDNAR
jgi:thiol-disulfide isomerase/thioredoxin